MVVNEEYLLETFKSFLEINNVSIEDVGMVIRYVELLNERIERDIKYRVDDDS